MTAPETIGICEWCGRTDYHLVHGTCSECRAHVIEYGFDHDGQPLGADAGAFVEELVPAPPTLCEEA